MGSNLTQEQVWQEWEAIDRRLCALDHSMWARATALSGLGAGRNVWHNAMLALECGKPWPEVDYSKLRQAIRLDALRYTGGGGIADLRRRLVQRTDRLLSEARGGQDRGAFIEYDAAHGGDFA